MEMKNHPMSDQSLEDTLHTVRLMKWRVSVHYEFETHGLLQSFWLFTHPCGKWIKAEGPAASEVLVLQLALGDALDHHCDAQTNP